MWLSILDGYRQYQPDALSKNKCITLNANKTIV